MKGVGSMASLVPMLERLEIDSETYRGRQIEQASESSPQVSGVDVVAELPEGKAEKEDHCRRNQNSMGGQ